MDVFLEALQQEEERIHTVVKEIILSPSEEQEFQQATHYHICREELGVDRVRDHCYLTGKFRGGGGGGGITLAISIFNSRVEFRSFFIISEATTPTSLCKAQEKLKNKTINCIPNNMEKYISFSIGHLDFLDSLQFMNVSLGKFVLNLAKEMLNFMFSSASSRRAKYLYC